MTHQVIPVTEIDPLDPRRQRRQTFHMARRVIASLAKDLRSIDERLGTLAAAIPEPGDEFELLEELGAGVRCVRGDLLSDAIQTLEALACLDDDGLCRRYEERQRLLAARVSKRLPDRLLRDGAQSFSDAELLAVLLHSSCRGTSALRLAGNLLENVGGLASLATVNDDILDQQNIGPVRAAVLMASREMAARMCRAQLAEKEVLDHPAAIASYVTMQFFRPDQEMLGVLFLDVGNRLIADREIFRGSLSKILVEPRQILRAALRHRAAGVVVFHTHPSGDPTPSEDDLAFTNRLSRAGDLVGVRLLDHLVVGGMGRWVSMKRKGDL